MDKKVRSSNLELYRIVCMLMIVAHHFVVNSGLAGMDGPLSANPGSAQTYFCWLWGMWGKTGINCFLLITGYFMCKSKISVQKFLKLLLEIYFYRIVIFLIFACVGRESVTFARLISLIAPFTGFSTNFVDCFLGFYLTIPFLNILVQKMNKKQHQWLLVVSIGLWTVCGNIPGFHVTLNYVTWFGIIYFIASYIRLHPAKSMENTALWGGVMTVTILLSVVSVVVLQRLLGNSCLFFMMDSNKILPVAVAVSSFLWFKNLKIPQSKLINAIGGSTFGVLLIHANSTAMRQWLWSDTIDCVGHYFLPFWHLVGYSVISVLAIFAACIIIDRLRIRFIEIPFFNKFSDQFDRWEQKLFGVKS